MKAKTNSTGEIVNILIVDDSPTQLEQLKYILEQNSYNVTAANSGRQALELIGKNIPTLIITDIVMPEMSGYELCQKIKAEEKTKNIPVILLTSLSSTEDVLEGLACGADNFISKPYSEQYLLTNIVNILVNAKLRKSEYVRMGMEIQFGGKKRFITADQQQMLSMLISTYEAAVNRNKELIQAQQELKTLNDNLEDLVEKRTAMLNAEITERKQAEESLQESEKKYRDLFENSADAIFIADTETGIILDVNKMAEKIVGRPRHELIGLNRAILHPQTEEYAGEFSRHVVASDVIDAESLVVNRDGRFIPVSINMSILEIGGRKVAQGIFRDITERRQADEKLQRTLESLRKSFGATIQVMVSAVEMRDPYTSGHQLRTANLALAIATEMGLPDDRIEGIRMAGSIHDIGKLSVPAEILSKPTKLTNDEFSIIKEHARKGYEMLKDVESPWPLAQIVYQHHERMDGSGYPRNLKGDEILIEARIMVVADVVEAMASNRPYRAALGIEKALEEIEKNRGRFYDADAVDACLKLFREKGFQLEAT